jgi:hypothetical protein
MSTNQRRTFTQTWFDCTKLDKVSECLVVLQVVLHAFARDFKHRDVLQIDVDVLCKLNKQIFYKGRRSVNRTANSQSKRTNERTANDCVWVIGGATLVEARQQPLIQRSHAIDVRKDLHLVVRWPTVTQGTLIAA